VKLLRVLEQREVTPVGDARPRAFHARLIAATNRSLPEMTRSGEFREDLYFRLSVFRIHLPPLRERKEDIPLLAEHFLRRCRAPGVSTRMSPEFLAALADRPWPGNVRELRNVIEHAAIISRGGVLGTEHLVPSQLPLAAAASEGEGTSEQVAAWAKEQSRSTLAGGESGVYEQYLSLVEPPLLRAVLEECSHNRALAAQRLGIHRATLRQKLRKYGIG
jgi:DNA-binding NtrC family response regulator